MRDLLKERARPGVITLRNPFRYFAARYEVPILYTIVPNPDAPDATAKAAAEGKRLAQEKGIRSLLAPLAAKVQALPLGQSLGPRGAFGGRPRAGSQDLFGADEAIPLYERGKEAV